MAIRLSGAMLTHGCSYSLSHAVWCDAQDVVAMRRCVKRLVKGREDMHAAASITTAPAVHRGIEGYEGAITEAYAPMRVTPSHATDRYRWAVQGERCGELRLTRIYAEGAIRAHIPADTVRSRTGQILLIYVENGAFQFEQAGQRAQCETGSLVLMDASQPLRAAQDGLAELLSIVFPAARLRAEVSHLDHRCTSPVNVRPGASTVLRDVMQSAWRERKALSQEGSSALPRLFGRLIEDIFPDNAGPRRGPREAHLPAARDIIHAELRNPALSPRLIANRLGLSESYLFSLAREAGVSLHEEIIQARLSACREALLSPVWGTASITEIALDFGFQDPAHFSRRFRARFGCTPSSLRQRPRILERESTTRA